MSQISNLIPMLFEEFFKKKKIDLATLQQGEPALFSEFKTHYEQMGEKSFDHTKKYWFNKLRRQFPLAPEVKAEKLIMENRLAEQTINESLSEQAAPAAKMGFTPKFKAAASKPRQEEPNTEENAAQTDADASAKPAFKPRFNSAMAKPKPAEADDSAGTASGTTPESATPSATDSPAKPAFKPRFNPGMVKPKAAEDTTAEAKAETSEDKPAGSTDAPAKPGFKPRFNAAMMKPKPAEAEKTPAAESQAPATPSKTQSDVNPESEAKPATEPTAAKMGFKPRFNAADMKPKSTESKAPKVDEAGQATPNTKTEPQAQADEKPAEETAKPEEPPIDDPGNTPQKPKSEPEAKSTESAPPKLGFKPRFNAAAMKPKPDADNDAAQSTES